MGEAKVAAPAAAAVIKVLRCIMLSPEILNIFEYCRLRT
jgi:hypothetical protein